MRWIDRAVSRGALRKHGRAKVASCAAHHAEELVRSRPLSTARTAETNHPGQHTVERAQLRAG